MQHQEPQILRLPRSCNPIPIEERMISILLETLLKVQAPSIKFSKNQPSRMLRPRSHLTWSTSRNLWTKITTQKLWLVHPKGILVWQTLRLKSSLLKLWVRRRGKTVVKELYHFLAKSTSDNTSSRSWWRKRPSLPTAMKEVIIQALIHTWTRSPPKCSIKSLTTTWSEEAAGYPRDSKSSQDSPSLPKKMKCRTRDI